MGGRLMRGRYGTGGEIGHAGFDPDGPPCPHGGRGCLEMYCSATALVAQYISSGGRSDSTTRSIVEGARNGEQLALGAVSWAGRNLGRGLASLANVVPPDLILIGGGLSGAGELLLRPVREGFAAQALPHVTKGVRIRGATLGNHAGLVGAALLAFEEGLP
jgi:glucokinase